MKSLSFNKDSLDVWGGNVSIESHTNQFKCYSVTHSSWNINGLTH